MEELTKTTTYGSSGQNLSCGRVDGYEIGRQRLMLTPAVAVAVVLGLLVPLNDLIEFALVLTGRRAYQRGNLFGVDAHFGRDFAQHRREHGLGVFWRARLGATSLRVATIPRPTSILASFRAPINNY